MLERFTIATFAEHLDETFRVYPDPADAGRFLDVALIEATDLSPREGQPAAAQERRAPFSIVFRGPATPSMPASPERRAIRDREQGRPGQLPSWYQLHGRTASSPRHCPTARSPSHRRSAMICSESGGPSISIGW